MTEHYTHSYQVPVPENTSLVSRTDTRGVIQYVNRPFVEISGYTEDELLGQPHRIIRHPEMPSVVFEDMWKTLKSGHSWRGMVKNRCKNGSFYWVCAHVTPLYRGTELIGYESVRTHASMNDVHAASVLYARLQSGELSASAYRRAHGTHGQEVKQQRISLTSHALMMLAPIVAGTGVMLPLSDAQNFAWVAGSVAIGVTTSWYLKHVALDPLKALSRYLGLVAGRSSDAAQLPTVSALGAPALRKANQARVNHQALVQDVFDSVRSAEQTALPLQNIATSLVSDVTRFQRVLANALEGATQVEAGAKDNVQLNTDARALLGELATVTVQGSEAMAEVAHTIAQLKATSSQIEHISGLIGSVAFQTNMLSLNAAIEAARAGEHGRGFRAVAEEVRLLAAQCAQAAQDIKALTSQTSTDITRCTSVVNEAHSVVSRIGESTARLGEAGETIHATSLNQQQSMSSVRQGLDSAAKMLEGVEDSAHECKSLADDMQARSARLRATVTL